MTGQGENGREPEEADTGPAGPRDRAGTRRARLGGEASGGPSSPTSDAAGAGPTGAEPAATADVELADGWEREVETDAGPARAWAFAPAGEPVGLVVLTHGAGGGVSAPDVRAAAGVALAAGYAVALVDQPYRVAGRRLPPRGTAADDAFVQVVAALARNDLGAGPGGGVPSDAGDRVPGTAWPEPAEEAEHPAGPGPESSGTDPDRRERPRLVVGGRSFGARVACRGAAATGADAVLALAFPTVPKGRPDKTRLPELAAVEVPTLAIVGERDPFGRPDPAELPAHVEVALVPGDHSLSRPASLAAVRAAVAAWLPTH